MAPVLYTLLAINFILGVTAFVSVVSRPSHRRSH